MKAVPARDSATRQHPVDRLRYGGRAIRVATYEATVEDGQIRLSEPVRLPERAKVFVVVPGVEGVPRFHMASPQLVRPELAADFVKEVTEEPRDAVQ